MATPLPCQDGRVGAGSGAERKASICTEAHRYLGTVSVQSLWTTAFKALSCSQGRWGAAPLLAIVFCLEWPQGSKKSGGEGDEQGRGPWTNPVFLTRRVPAGKCTQSNRDCSASCNISSRVLPPSGHLWEAPFLFLYFEKYFDVCADICICRSVLSEKMIKNEITKGRKYWRHWNSEKLKESSWGGYTYILVCSFLYYLDFYCHACVIHL